MRPSVYLANIIGVIALFLILIWPFGYFFDSDLGSKALFSVLVFFGVTIFGEPGDTEMSATMLFSITSSVAIGFLVNYFLFQYTKKSNQNSH
jgi:hypothetical protein